MDVIRVHVIQEKDRKNLTLRFRDPVTGKHVKRSARTASRKEAERYAHQWEHDLNEGRYQAPSKTTWEVFREQYASEHLAGLAPATVERATVALDLFERIVSPRMLRDVTAARVSHFQAKLRERGRREATVASHLRHLGAALRWAHGVGMLVKPPKIHMPHRAKGKAMKGRPITTEEFERMLDRVADVLTSTRRTRNKPNPDPPDPAVVESWKYLLTGLWWSGLRLAESQELYWDRDDKLRVDFDGKYPMLRIPAHLEKGNKDRLLPVAPEFAEFLRAVPEDQRIGPVFKPLPRRDITERITSQHVGRVITLIGEKAGVVVDRTTKQVEETVDGKTRMVEKEVVKYASAHDLRRSFGERWAARVMPQVLMQMMRHEDIATTMKYYVGRNAENTARVLWEAAKEIGLGTTLGTSDEKTATAGEAAAVVNRGNETA